MKPKARHCSGAYTLAVVVFLFISAFALNSKAQADPDQLVREVVANELKAQEEDQTHWRYLSLKEEGGKKELRDAIQAKDATIERLLAVNGHALTPEQRRKEDARIQRLINSPAELRKKQKERHEDGEQERRMLRMLPEAFLYQYDGTEGSLIRLKFRPKPNFHPSSREAQVFHSMEGTMWIEGQQKRLARMDGRLTKEVKFGGGILGHLDPGGTFFVEQADVGSGHWDLIVLDVRMKGKALFFKTINVQQREYLSRFQRVPDDLTLQQAADILKKDATAAGVPDLSRALGAGATGAPVNHVSN